MSLDWMDEFIDEDPLAGEDSTGAFYCPYTNGAECALFSKGWQPQDLCEALECDQLNLFQRRVQRREEAA